MDGEEMQQAWSFLVKGEERQYAGNSGYDDLVHAHYDFDSNVPNSKRVSQGDVVVVRDADYVLGTSIIDELTSWQGEKDLSRCPNCSYTQIKKRLSVSPLYRCQKCRREFEVPASETVNVTMYRAKFGSAWRPARGLPVAELEKMDLFLAKSKTNSIRGLQPAGLKALLSQIGLWP